MGIGRNSFHFKCGLFPSRTRSAVIPHTSADIVGSKPTKRAGLFRAAGTVRFISEYCRKLNRDLVGSILFIEVLFSSNEEQLSLTTGRAHQTKGRGESIKRCLKIHLIAATRQTT